MVARDCADADSGPGLEQAGVGYRRAVTMTGPLGPGSGGA